MDNPGENNNKKLTKTKTIIPLKCFKQNMCTIRKMTNKKIFLIGTCFADSSRRTMMPAVN